VYINGKMSPVETSRNGERGIKENAGGVEINYGVL
jgi:hypothetical protein